MEIKNRILKTIKVAWKKLIILQPEGFKQMPTHREQKMKESLINSGFAASFKVWQKNENEILVLDGVHRIKCMTELESEGYTVPEKFPAEFIDCKDEKEACKYVLVYSSQYAIPTIEGLQRFMLEQGIELDFLENNVVLEELDMSGFRGELTEAELMGGEEGEVVPEIDEDTGKTKCKFPIVPRYNEKYDYVLIFCKNQMDFIHLQEIFALKKQQSYKNSNVGIGRVMPFEEFIELWKSKS